MTRRAISAIAQLGFLEHGLACRLVSSGWTMRNRGCRIRRAVPFSTKIPNHFAETSDSIHFINSGFDAAEGLSTSTRAAYLHDSRAGLGDSLESANDRS